MNKTTSTILGAAFIACAATTISFAGAAHADAGPVNLPLTDDVRSELVQAGAVLTGSPASDFTGLRPGKSYYAYMPDQDMYYAAAALSGAKTELAAINLQDQNSYMMFSKSGSPGATWVPTAAGFGPIAAGEAPCPIPQPVREAWQWPTDKCYPPPAA
jgi:hypothetical protein